MEAPVLLHVQHTWVDVRTVRPDNRAQVFVYAGLPEQGQIPQWAKERAEQERLAVDGAFGKSCQLLSGQLEYCSSRVGRQTKAQGLQLVKHGGQSGHQTSLLCIQ